MTSHFTKAMVATSVLALIGSAPQVASAHSSLAEKAENFSSQIAYSNFSSQFPGSSTEEPIQFDESETERALRESIDSLFEAYGVSIHEDVPDLSILEGSYNSIRGVLNGDLGLETATGFEERTKQEFEYQYASDTSVPNGSAVLKFDDGILEQGEEVLDRLVFEFVEAVDDDLNNELIEYTVAVEIIDDYVYVGLAEVPAE